MGLLIGMLIAIQVRSYDEVKALVSRDSESTAFTAQDTFRQIYTLKTANQSLKQEILTLEGRLAQYSDQATAHDIILAEIEKNESLAGLKPISGPGLTLTVDMVLPVEWMVDLTNEWWASGAEAVSVNGVRLTDVTDGFYSINKMVLLSGTILEAPTTFQAIGDAELMANLLQQPGGILARLEEASSVESFHLSANEKVDMAANPEYLAE